MRIFQRGYVEDEVFPLYVRAFRAEDAEEKGPCTVFGFVSAGELHIHTAEQLNVATMKAGSFFVRSLKEGETLYMAIAMRAVLVTYKNYAAPVPWVTGEVRSHGPGHLTYIDGCTDTLLWGPPKLGEPCLNALYFPPGIEQRFHTHPSCRIGCVIAGRGTANWLGRAPESMGADFDEPLKAGDVFYLPPDEVHRFKTSSKEGMTIVALHPDSDWGPTDDIHPMKNRTLEPELSNAR